MSCPGLDPGTEKRRDWKRVKYELSAVALIVLCPCQFHSFDWCAMVSMKMFPCREAGEGYVETVLSLSLLCKSEVISK